MQLQADMSSTSRYAVFRYVTDPQRDVSLPVGVALWRTDGEEIEVRFLAQDEIVRGASSPEARQFMDNTQANVRDWLESGELPYGTSDMSPLSDAWWELLGDLLQFRVRVSRPMAIDCTSPAEEIGPLYQAIVGPEVRTETRQEQVRGAITRALGPVAADFERRPSVAAYHDSQVTVERLFRARNKQVIAEGVDLSLPESAFTDADALTSRLQRVRAGSKLPTEFIIGYISSPGGLNGEYVMVEWMRERLHADLFDLIRERDQFRTAAQAAIASPSQLPLPEGVGE